MRLERADEATVKVAVATAWRNVAEVGDACEAVDAGVASANVSAAEVIEDGCAGKVAAVGMGNAVEISATPVNVAGKVTDDIDAAGVSAAEVPNEAPFVPVEDGAVTVEPPEHLLSERQATIAGNHEARSMAFTLLAVVKRENMIDLKYGEAYDDPKPFVLTVTPQYVAHETAKSLPISASEVHAHILAHAAKLRAIAQQCKEPDLISEVLK
jgi:hypothetical protein